jgi:hypothetical protein
MPPFTVAAQLSCVLNSRNRPKSLKTVAVHQVTRPPRGVRVFELSNTFAWGRLHGPGSCWEGMLEASRLRSQIRRGSCLMAP